MMPQRLRRFVFIAAAACTGLASCSPKAPTLTLDGAATTNSDVEAIFQEACNRFEAGDLEAADEKFARISREYPRDPLRRAAAIYRARIALKLDNPERARTLLSPIKGTDDATAERALLYDAAATAALGQNDEAAAVLKTLVDRLTNKEDIIVLETTLGNAARKTGDIVTAAASLDRLLSVTENASERRDLLRAFRRSISETQDIGRLERAAESLPRKSEVRPVLKSRVADIHLDAGRYQEAQEILDRLDRETARKTDATVPETASPAENVDIHAVGLLVPLSGRARLLGEAALKGAQLAAQETGITLAVRDSKSSPEEVALALESLVTVSQVAGVIGPLDSTAAEAAAHKAQSLGVPILLLSPKEETTAVGDFVFREFAGNRVEPEILVQLVKARGLTRLSVLFPDTGYGRGMRALFVNAAATQGLHLVAESSYPQDAVNFKQQAEALAAAAPDVVFLPDHASKIALIAPALAAAGLQSAPPGTPETESTHPVQLIVPSVGFSEDLLRRAGRYLNGAVFSVYFSADLNLTGADFSAKYHLEYGTRPNLIAAYGYDATLILGEGLKSGVETRKDLRQWLTDNAAAAAADLKTAAPFAGFSAHGAPTAKPYIVQLQGTQISRIEAY